MESQLATGLRCTECGDEIEIVTDGWLFAGTVLCTMCWEDYAGDTWWEELRRMQDTWQRDLIPPLHPSLARSLNATRDRQIYAEPAGALAR